MAMSIRSSEVETLARKLASRTGISMTETIEKALEAMDASGVAEAEIRYGKIVSIASRCAAIPDLDVRSADEILGYGPDGLPS
jgi:antitoxin VapB